MPDTIIKKMIMHQKDSSGNDIIMRPQTESSQIVDFGSAVRSNIKNYHRFIEFITGTQTASTPSFTGVTEDASLYDGKCINYYLPYAGTSAGDTLNLTLADSTTTGAKQIYLFGTTKLTTQFAAGQIFMMTYSATKDAWYVGDLYAANSNNYDRNIHNDNIKAVSAIAKNQIIVGDAAGYKKAAAGVTFDITYPIMFASAAIAANAAAKTAYEVYPSVPVTTTVANWTGTQYAMMFMVGTLSGTTFTIDSSVFTTTLPVTANGKVYIPIGICPTTTTVNFYPQNEFFEYKDGSFRPYSIITPISQSEIQSNWDNLDPDETILQYATAEEVAAIVDARAKSISKRTLFFEPVYDTLDLNDVDVSNETSFETLFGRFGYDESHSIYPIYKTILCSTWNTSNVTNMFAAFAHAYYLENLDVTNWDTSNVTTMESMFYNCGSLQSLDLSTWDTSNVLSMAGMFQRCYKLITLDLSNFDTTKVGTVQMTGTDWDGSSYTYYGSTSRFDYCESLQYIIIGSPTFKFPLNDDLYLSYSCKILVPSALISTYQNATYWTSYSSSFEPIENYTITRNNGHVTVTPNS